MPPREKQLPMGVIGSPLIPRDSYRSGFVSVTQEGAATHDHDANQWLKMQTAAAGVDQRTGFTSSTNGGSSRIPLQLARKYLRGFLRLGMCK